MVQFLVRLSLSGRTLGEGPSDGLEEPDVVPDLESFVCGNRQSERLTKLGDRLKQAVLPVR